MEPEICKTTFEGPLLRLLSLVNDDTPLEYLLSNLVTCPPKAKSDCALTVLSSMGLCQQQAGSWRLTNQGRIACQLPVEPRVAKMLVRCHFFSYSSLLTTWVYFQ